MEVIESFCQGKRPGAPCEDGFVVTDNFAAVIDGSTSKGKVRLHGKTSGLAAMEIVRRAIRALPARCAMPEAARHLTRSLHQAYEREGLLAEARQHAENRLTCSCVVFSRWQKEVWFFGDCQCRMNGQTHTRPKTVDLILSAIRSDAISYLLSCGHTEEALRKNDLGRAFILDALRDQCAFQNAPADNPYSYPVLDGFEMDLKQVSVLHVPDCKQLILASDGYPQLFDTLEETEASLSRTLRDDPLCFRENRSTKCLLEGNVSFDDRTYLRITL